MSAFHVSKRHIDALVTGLLAHQIIGPSEADEVGAELWRENYASVNYRYSEKNKAPKYAFALNSRSAVAVYKAAQCYSYQSNEHKAWESSRANALMDMLMKATKCHDATPGYETAPWAIV